MMKDFPLPVQGFKSTELRQELVHCTSGAITNALSVPVFWAVVAIAESRLRRPAAAHKFQINT